MIIVLSSTKLLSICQFNRCTAAHFVYFFFKICTRKVFNTTFFNPTNRILSHPVLLYALSTASVLFQAWTKEKKTPPHSLQTDHRVSPNESNSSFPSRGEPGLKYARRGWLSLREAKPEKQYCNERWKHREHSLTPFFGTLQKPNIQLCWPKALFLQLYPY